MAGKEVQQNGLRGGIPQKKFILSEFLAFPGTGERLTLVPAARLPPCETSSDCDPK
jgi:hypothetical protein